MMSDAAVHYRQGLALFSERRFSEAARRFEAAIGAQRTHAAARPPNRCLSYLALSRSLASGKPRGEDLRLAEQAATSDPFDPLLRLNLGRLCLLAGLTTRALASFERGLRLDPMNRQLVSILSAHDRRRPPLVPGLGRDHVVNRSFGKLRSKLGGRKNATAS
jgi:tetratricopeptide (TPR) repeat protein